MTVEQRNQRAQTIIVDAMRALQDALASIANLDHAYDFVLKVKNDLDDRLTAELKAIEDLTIEGSETRTERLLSEHYDAPQY